MTDNDGTPVRGAKVTVSLEDYEWSGPSVLTDSRGSYEISFNGVPGSMHHPGRDPAGTEKAVAFAQVEAPGYERFARYVLGTTPHLVEHVRLHRIRRITAGDAVRLAITPDSTMCVMDVWPGRDLICGIVRVAVPNNGTLTVEALPIEAGSRRPGLEVYGGNTGSRGNPTAIQVFAGTEYTVMVKVPWGDNAEVLVKTILVVQ